MPARLFLIGVLIALFACKKKIGTAEYSSIPMGDELTLKAVADTYLASTAGLKGSIPEIDAAAKALSLSDPSAEKVAALGRNPQFALDGIETINELLRQQLEQGNSRYGAG